jgi:FAD/FMN-containing dehydrogenase
VREISPKAGNRYDGPAPRVNGSIALDLHHIDKVIEVNADYAYTVVEPGVTFTDLYDYCVAHKLKVWPSGLLRGWVSQPLDTCTKYLTTLP